MLQLVLIQNPLNYYNYFPKHPTPLKMEMVS